MYFITAFGSVMICLSLVMIVNPRYWSDSIVTFSKKSYFHWFEVVSRLVVGFVFVGFSQSTLYPQLTLGIGCLLIAVGFGLIVIGAVKHREFAVWSALKFRGIFRLAGCVSLVFGLFLIYVATSNTTIV